MVENGPAFPKPKREKLETDAYKEFAQEILRRDGYSCRNPLCGSPLRLTVHHLKKRSQLGGDIPGNALTLCVSCHERVERNELEITVIDVVVKFEDRSREEINGKGT